MKFKIKETYLIILILIGLVSLSVYTTYALFTASSEIENVVNITTSLSLESNIIEYEMVTIPAGETRIIELNVTNSSSGTLYYGAWYQMVNPSVLSDDIQLGLYTDKNSTPGSGTVAGGGRLSLLVGIANDSAGEVIINIGVVGSVDNNLGLGTTRALIPSGFVQEVIVTDEYLEEHTIITPGGTVNDTYNYTGAVQEVTLMPGTYKLETWGAQGGTYSSGAGGLGGYSYGTLTLDKSTDIFIYVGQQPTSTTGGFNGGTTTSNYGRGGGGASDIRIGQDSLYARVIVAGGGGSNGYSSASPGGYGGGTSGGTGTAGTYAAGGGGTQTSGGSSYNPTGNGKFGEGGYYNTAGGGAGGGWYGGGHGYGGGIDSAGGGGSGYVYTSTTASNYPSGCLLNSSYYLTNAATVAGNTSFANVAGTGNETGHAGNGAVKISGTAQTVAYTIPRLVGLKDLTMELGTSLDLTEDVTLECAFGESECSIVEVSITDTSTLAEGDYVVSYKIKGKGAQKYIYTRNLKVEDNCSRVNTVLGTLSYNCNTPNFTLTSCDNSKIEDETYRCGESTVGVYSAQDDLGTSYYFRGDVENNYVKFGKYKSNMYFAHYYVESGTSISSVNVLTTKTCAAIEAEVGGNFLDCFQLASAGDDMYWRIIRLNGDGTIRMIYAGTSPQENGSAEYYAWTYGNVNRTIFKNTIGAYYYNSSYDSNAYVGYMYGTPTSTSYSTTHANNTSSAVKTYIDNWYNANFYNTTYANYIADSIYCNDRAVSTSNSMSYTGNGASTNRTGYKALERLYYSLEVKTPSLKCTQTNDRFSKSTTVSGLAANGKLTYPVGMLTADEAVFAGGTGNTRGISNYPNLYYYLYSGNSYWTMTPAYMSNQTYAYVNSYASAGYTYATNTNSSFIGIRPVISLKSTVTVKGTGKINDPYTIS